MDHITTALPSNEEIGQALRKDIKMYPKVAVRELVANAVIHQDFFETGSSVMVEIFANRIEITNPGVPLVEINRFLDTPPKSRNEDLASFLRRIGICEERGSGIDKVVLHTELHQLPAPTFQVVGDNTRIVLYAPKPYAEMDKQERVWACYLHTCLKYVSHDAMTNASLRERFRLDQKNSAGISRLIKDALEKGFIKAHDPEANRRNLRYVPFWS